MCVGPQHLENPNYSHPSPCGLCNPGFRERSTVDIEKEGVSTQNYTRPKHRPNTLMPFGALGLQRQSNCQPQHILDNQRDSITEGLIGIGPAATHTPTIS